MAETANYKLIITDDGTTRFLDWRNAINGASNSNMEKIDQALGEKANNSVAISGVLYASAWIGATPPFTQGIPIDGLTPDQNGIISIPYDATTTQRECAREAILSVVEQTDGLLTIAADGEVPKIDIPVYIILLG